MRKRGWDQDPSAIDAGYQLHVQAGSQSPPASWVAPRPELTPGRETSASGKHAPPVTAGDLSHSDVGERTSRLAHDQEIPRSNRGVATRGAQPPKSETSSCPTSTTTRSCAPQSRSPRDRPSGGDPGGVRDDESPTRPPSPPPGPKILLLNRLGGTGLGQGRFAENHPPARRLVSRFPIVEVGENT